MCYLEIYHFWLENEYFDQQAKTELRALAGNDEEIKDRFYKDLEFGTGGLRGKIAIGTNPDAKITGCTLEDEKVLGTMHIGFGNNVSFGGKVVVKCHFDGVIQKPTLVIDGKTILEEGELQV